MREGARLGPGDLRVGGLIHATFTSAWTGPGRIAHRDALVGALEATFLPAAALLATPTIGPSMMSSVRTLLRHSARSAR